MKTSDVLLQLKFFSVGNLQKMALHVSTPDRKVNEGLFQF